MPGTLKSREGAVGTFATIAKWQIEQNGQKVTQQKEGTYTGPAINPDRENNTGALETLRAYFQSVITTDDAAGAFFDAWNYGVDLKAKAKLRPAAGVDTPWISRDGVRINLGTGERIGKDGKAMAALPLDKVISFVQRAHDEAADLDLEPAGAAVVGRKMLLESGVAIERNGKLVAKPQK
jgi:hypothetical protein